MANDNIHVERDGVVLGWRLVVVLAAAVLGIYIATVVGPLASRIDTLDSNMAKIEQELHNHKRDLDMTRSHIMADKQIRPFTETALKDLRAGQSRLREALQTHALDHANDRRK